MKVFMCQNKIFSDGLAIVAANSIDEAFMTFFDHDDNRYMLDSQWVTDHYPLEDWFELPKLTAEVEKPCIIINNYL